MASANTGCLQCHGSKVALLAKEAALSIVALLTVACVIERGRMAWRWALLGVAVPSLLYLLLRFGVLTQVNDGDAAYAWSLANLPQRWLEYQAYGPQVSLFETQNTLSRGWSDPRFVVALLLWMALLAALTSAGWRWALALVAGGLAALGPVLVLDSASTQYGYGFAAFTAGLVAAAWPRIPYWGRAVVLLLALLNLWHGVNVMRQMRAVGEIQAVFSPAMVAALQADPVATLRLQPAPEADAWIFQRLTHHIPRIGDVAIGNRIRLVAPGEPTDTAHVDYVIEADGRLTLPRPLPSQR